MCYLNDLRDTEVRIIGGGKIDSNGLEDAEHVTPSKSSVPIINRILKTVASPTIYDNFDRLIEGSDAVVSVELFSFLSRQAVAHATRHHAKVLVIVWETISSHPFYKIPPYSWNAAIVGKFADAFVTTSNRAAKHLGDLGVPRERVRVIYPGVDTKVFHPPLNDERPIGTPRLLYVGLLSRHKGFQLLLEAYQQAKRNAEIELHVAGDGPLRGLLRGKLGEGVVYHGRPSLWALAELHRKCSIFVSLPMSVRRLGLKTWEEQYGFTLVEAMASGLTIIGSDCGAIREIVGDNNFVVPEGSAEEAAKKITYLAKHLDEVKMRGANNVKRVDENFNLGKQSTKFERFIISTIDSS